MTQADGIDMSGWQVRQGGARWSLVGDFWKALSAGLRRLDFVYETLRCNQRLSRRGDVVITCFRKTDDRLKKEEFR